MTTVGQLSTEELSKLTTLMFAAAMGQIGWDKFLEALSVKAGDIRTHVMGFDIEANVSIDFAAVGYDPDFLKNYSEHFSGLNAWASGFMASPVGKTIDSEEMCSTEKLLKTEFYNDWVKPQENIIHGGGALLFKNDTRVFAVGGNIRLKDADKLKGAWLQIVNQLTPHMQQAFEITRALAGSKLETALVASNHLSEVPAIVVLSEMGRIIFANEPAQSMIGRGQPIACDMQSRLICCTKDRGNQRTHDLMAYHLMSSAQSFTIVSQPTEDRTVYDFRFAKLTPDAQVALPLDATLGFSQRCTLLLIVPKKLEDHSYGRLQTAYGLTEAELSLVGMLVDGLTNPQIAEQRERSVSTINAQVKSILSKTQSRTRTRFAQLVGGFASDNIV